MSDIKYWSTAAASNNSAPPNGWPENMAPNMVNDSAREMQAAIRRQFENAEWFDWGHTPTYVSATSFTISGDQTSIYHKNRRVKVSDSSTLYGTIDTCSYSTNTGVVIVLDSGNLTAAMSAVAVGVISYANTSMPNYISFANSASSATTLGGKRWQTSTAGTVVIAPNGTSASFSLENGGQENLYLIDVRSTNVNVPFVFSHSFSVPCAYIKANASGTPDSLQMVVFNGYQTSTTNFTVKVWK